MRSSNDSIWKDMDWSLLTIYGILLLFGWLNIYAAIFDVDNPTGIFDMGTKSGKQFLWISVSVVTIVLILLLDFKFLFSIPYVAFVGAAILLVLVAFFGAEIKGARSWFRFGGFSIQPSEFAKVAACLAVAKYMGDKGSQFRYGLNMDTVILFAIVFFMPALIMLQPDAGSAMVYSSFIIMMCIDGLTFAIPVLGIIAASLFVMTNLYFEEEVELLLIALAVLGSLFTLFYKKLDLKIRPLVAVPMVLITFSIPIGLFWYDPSYNLIALGIYMIIIVLSLVNALLRKSYVNLNLLVAIISLVSVVVIVSNAAFEKLATHQQNRMRVLKDPYIDPKGKGWNIIQSSIAISSGGITGKGFKEGTITKGNWVPEQHTDFIFCTIAEERGFIGTTVVILLFVTLIIRLGILSQRQKSRFTQVYGYSVMGIIFFHFLINIGMVIGLLPVIGIPLPFFSYGGSSLWSFSILIAIMVKLDMHRAQILARN